MNDVSIEAVLTRYGSRELLFGYYALEKEQIDGSIEAK